MDLMPIMLGELTEPQKSFLDKSLTKAYAKKGINEKIVREISWHKSEPDWMLNFRLEALKYFYSKALPTWGGDLTRINFDDIYYYL